MMKNYNELVDRLIYIKDHYDLSFSDNEAINDACNILEEAMRNEQN